ncbi:MAG: FAD-dependent oxidoreductase [Candidatus Bathycorpusculaceae bacterium]
MPRVGVYVCHCGLNIAGVVDVEKVVEYAKTLPDVAVARHYTYMCSEPGQRMIQDDIKAENLDRVLIATCSPKMHEETFRKTVAEAGLNPYLLEIVNLREHVSWAHSEEPGKATEKAKDLVRMGLARARLLEPLQTNRVPAEKSVLVVGGGIAGIQAALDSANAGLKVFLVEKAPSIGGKMALLDKTFPTLDCSACILTPKMTEVVRHPNIELISYADVEKVSGYVGNYEVTILKKPRYVDEDKCTGCGECTKECTVEMDNEFELGLGKRKAIFRPFPQAAPNVFTIDKKGTPRCRATCPAGLNAQGYIALIAQGKFREAYELIRQQIPFPGILGRICFHPCESECERGDVDAPIAICALKRFVADYIMKQPPEPVSQIPKVHDEKIAVIGSGPAGLTVAYELVKAGYQVTVFESMPEPGGMMRYGIPDYRLPKNVVKREIEYLEDLGVDIITDVTFGGDITLSDLKAKDYKAVFIATGAWKSPKMGIEGEQLQGVLPAVDFLKDVNMGREVEVGKRVAVIGGGNVAIDAARVALRLGSKQVFILYRRSRAEMPAFQPEVEEAEKEGVKILFLELPKRILGKDGRVVAVECLQMSLTEPDGTGRRQVVPIEGSEHIIEVDTVIPAIGQILDPRSLPRGTQVTTYGIYVDPNTLQTSIPGVFAGGDAVLGPATVIEAVADGQKAAFFIQKHLRGEDLKAGAEREMLPPVPIAPKVGVEKKSRQVMPTLPVRERAETFEEVELGFTEEMAIEEAKRCLACGGCSECLECVKVCEANAIDHAQTPQRISVKVGAIVIATGSELFDASQIPEFGFGRSKNIITNLQFERLSNAAGPTGGEIVCPETGEKPKSVVFIQCVGSRDLRFNEYCCRIGCMATLKQAILTREKLGKDVNIYICLIDMRAFGKGYEEFYRRARDMDINFVAGIPSDIRVDANGSIQFDVFDKGTNKLLELRPDLVVLASGLIPNADMDKISALFHASRSADGFLLEAHPKLRPLESAISGVFLAGACQGPKDIPDSVAQASGAAAKAVDLLASGQIELEPLKAVVDKDLCSGCRVCESVCPFIAIEMKTEAAESNGKLRAEVIEAMCQGCGLCVATCPTNAIKMRHYTDEQVLAQIQAAYLETAAEGGS